MPLPQPAARGDLHTRSIELLAYARQDGLFDLEGHLVDRKPHDFVVAAGRAVAAGDAIHEMWVRLTIDDSMLIVDASAATDAMPYGTCAAGPATIERLRGVRIGPGWRRDIQQRLGGALGCTHLTELLGPLASTATQALIEHRRARPEAVDASGRPLLIDSCLSLAAGSEVAMKRWPSTGTEGRS